MLILLDENVPAGVCHYLSGHAVRTTPDMGWEGLSNGQLLAAAEQAGFEAMITGDQNMVYQQNLSRFRLAVIAIGTTHWPTIRADLVPLRDAVAAARPGAYVTVEFARLCVPPDRL